mmetsp:Transcript_61610/g.156604  ORF Transcript_61610/g.156604 Transcript_61610/m.156604 type:complete len:90 (+) Transcript_61610:793-1062(+)
MSWSTRKRTVSSIASKALSPRSVVEKFRSRPSSNSAAMLAGEADRAEQWGPLDRGRSDLLRDPTSCPPSSGRGLPTAPAVVAAEGSSRG